MRIQLTLLALVFSMLTAITANAANLQNDEQLIREGIDFAEQFNFRMTYYKFQAVKTDIIDLPPSPTKDKLVNAVDLTIMKVQDHYLNDYEKRDVVRDCGQVALDAIDDLSFGDGPIGSDLDQALDKMKRVLNKVKQGNTQRALNLLGQIENILFDYDWDPQIQKALNAVNVIQQKIQDSFLTQYEKELVTADCKRVFDDAVKSSQAYQGGGHLPPPQAHVAFDYQGKVRHGSGRYSSYGELKTSGCYLEPQRAYITYKNRGVQLTHLGNGVWKFHTDKWNRKKQRHIDLVVHCGGQEFRLSLYK